MSATTKEEIQEWLKEAKKKKCSHLIVACDRFSYEDYPVFVNPDEDIYERIRHYSQNMQIVMEVYSMKMDLETQLRENRSYHPDHT